MPTVFAENTAEQANTSSKFSKILADKRHGRIGVHTPVARDKIGFGVLVRQRRVCSCERQALASGIMAGNMEIVEPAASGLLI